MYYDGALGGMRCVLFSTSSDRRPHVIVLQREMDPKTPRVWVSLSRLCLGKRELSNKTNDKKFNFLIAELFCTGRMGGMYWRKHCAAARVPYEIDRKH